MPAKSNGGFSLPELMICVSILLIFTTVAIPAMAEFIDHQRANAFIRQFSQHLAYARVAATSSNLPVQLCPVADSRCERQWHRLPLQLAILQPDGMQPVLLREIPPINPQHKLVYHRDALTFRRDGSLNGFENGTFYYCGRAGSRWHFRLTLNQAGRSRLKEVTAPCPV